MWLKIVFLRIRMHNKHTCTHTRVRTSIHLVFFLFFRQLLSSLLLTGIFFFSKGTWLLSTLMEFVCVCVYSAHCGKTQNLFPSMPELLGPKNTFYCKTHTFISMVDFWTSFCWLRVSPSDLRSLGEIKDRCWVNCDKGK